MVGIFSKDIATPVGVVCLDFISTRYSDLESRLFLQYTRLRVQIAEAVLRYFPRILLLEVIQAMKYRIIVHENQKINKDINMQYQHSTLENKLIFSIVLEQKVCHPKPIPECLIEQRAFEWGEIVPEWFKVLPFNGITLKHLKKMKYILKTVGRIRKKHKEGFAFKYKYN